MALTKVKLVILLTLSVCQVVHSSQKNGKIDGAKNSEIHDETHEMEEDSVSLWFQIAFTVIIGCVVFYYIGITPQDLLHGVPLHKNITNVLWPLENPYLSVSNTKTLTVSFTHFNGKLVKNPTAQGQLDAQVSCDNHPVAVSVMESEDGENVLIVFNASKAGLYQCNLTCNGERVRGFPTTKRIHCGPVEHFQLTTKSQTLILTAGVPEDLKLNFQDKFGNEVEAFQLPSLSSRISFKLWYMDATNGGRKTEKFSNNFLVYLTESSKSICISVAFASGEEGWYSATVNLSDKALKSSEITMIVLSRNEKAKVDRFIHSRRHRDFYALDTEYFEAELIACHGQRLEKAKKVYCYLTDKQLSIREYFLKIFLRRTFSYRLVPATKLSLVRYLANAPVIRLSDGFQRGSGSSGTGPEICLKDGLLMVACFHRVLLERMGGSESFEDKRAHFSAMLCAYHSRKGHKHSPYYITVSRDTSLLKSSFNALKYLSEADWAKLFVIHFENESGIDEGGVRREWFSLVAKELLDPKSKFFVQVEEEAAAVMPNPYPPPNIKAKHYFKFAGKIIGKMLYETAQGGSYAQLLPCRLAKSFLVQLVGLRVNYRHFADDAPDLYKSKIRLIEGSDIDEPDSGFDDLTFSEDFLDQNTGQVHTVDLKPKGRHIRVTQADKMEYLDLLAQYRLSQSIREHIEAFLEGLHSLVPDSLLSMFDECELELLLCGVSEYKLSELRKNHTLVKDGLSAKIVSWFWLALSHFTAEQFARLLQFATGSSQLPPGGFASLRPKFQIASNHSYNKLPTAHTCFNMICLPDHPTFQDFEKALLLAITEGAEGFGLA